MSPPAFSKRSRDERIYSPTNGWNPLSIYIFSNCGIIHPGIPSGVRKLFDDGHYLHATFDAFKFVDKEVQRHSRIHENGFKLMMKAFGKSLNALQLNPLSKQSECDEQKGFQFMFAGSMLAIRNPRAHEVSISESPDQCLDHLSLASLLLRRLERAGFKCE